MLTLTISTSMMEESSSISHLVIQDRINVLLKTYTLNQNTFFKSALIRIHTQLTNQTTETKRKEIISFLDIMETMMVLEGGSGLDKGCNRSALEIIKTHNESRKCRLRQSNLYDDNEENAQENITNLSKFLYIPKNNTIQQVQSRSRSAREILQIIRHSNLGSVLQQLISNSCDADKFNEILSTSSITTLQNMVTGKKTNEDLPVHIHICSLDIKGMYIMNYHGQQLLPQDPKLPTDISLIYFAQSLRKSIYDLIQKYESLYEQTDDNRAQADYTHKINLLKSVKLVRNGGDEFSIILLSHKMEDGEIIKQLFDVITSNLTEVNNYLPKKFNIGLKKDFIHIDGSVLYEEAFDPATKTQINKSGNLHELTALITKGNLPHPEETKLLGQAWMHKNITSIYRSTDKLLQLSDFMIIMRDCLADINTSQCIQTFLSSPSLRTFKEILISHERLNNTQSNQNMSKFFLDIIDSNYYMRLKLETFLNGLCEYKYLMNPTGVQDCDLQSDMLEFTSQYLDTFLEQFNFCLQTFGPDKDIFLHLVNANCIRSCAYTSIDIKTVNGDIAQYDGDGAMNECMYDIFTILILSLLQKKKACAGQQLNIGYQELRTFIDSLRSHGALFDEVKYNVSKKYDLPSLAHLCVAQAGPDIIFSSLYAPEYELTLEDNNLKAVIEHLKHNYQIRVNNKVFDPTRSHLYQRLGNPTDHKSFVSTGIEAVSLDLEEQDNAHKIFEKIKTKAELRRFEVFLNTYIQCEGTLTFITSDYLNKYFSNLSREIRYIILSLIAGNNRSSENGIRLLEYYISIINTHIANEQNRIPPVLQMYTRINEQLSELFSKLNTNQVDKNNEIKEIEGILLQSLETLTEHIPIVNTFENTYVRDSDKHQCVKDIVEVFTKIKDNQDISIANQDIKKLKFVSYYCIVLMYQFICKKYVSLLSCGYDAALDSALRLTSLLLQLYKSPYPDLQHIDFTPSAPSLQPLRTTVYGAKK